MAILFTSAFGLAVLFAWKIWTLFRRYILKPREIRASFLQQGITGPPALPMVGNMLHIQKMRDEASDNHFSEITHDIVDHILPDRKFYADKYGKIYLIWFGHEPRINLEDPDMATEVLSKKAGHFGRSPFSQDILGELLGKGLVVSNGEDWAQRRRIVSPAFLLDKLKAMVGTMADCTLKMLEEWEMAIDKQGSEAEIDVSDHVIRLTADVISHTAFGSSYKKGEKVFEHLQTLELLVRRTKQLDWIPGKRLLPTVNNMQIWKLKKELNTILKELVKARRDCANNADNGNDLLGLMLTEAIGGEKSHGSFDNNKLIEECKTFYFAGHETTSTLLTWTLMLLAKHTLWQDQARSEVQEICNGAVPNADMLGKLKTVTMVINESLRLYPPVPFLVKGAFKDMHVGKLFIPEGVGSTIPILAFHHDPSLWGTDATEFNPARFEKGVANACKHPMAFMPFSAGPRNCVGQTFAMMEAKVVLALILTRFKFHLSQNYRHNPVIKFTMKPKHGMPLIVERWS